MIDLQTDPSQQGKQAQVSKLETHFSYDGRFQNSADMLLDNMYTIMSCPRVTARIPQGGGRERQGHAGHVLGSAMPVRGALGGMGPGAGCGLVREIVRQERVHGLGDWTDCRYTVQIEHLYPLTEDEDEERKLDLQGSGTAGAQPQGLPGQVAAGHGRHGRDQADGAGAGAAGGSQL